MARTIRDLKEFSKLYKVPVPVEEECAYYFATLGRSPQYGELDRWIGLFADLEERLQGTGESVAEHKMRRLGELKAFVCDTEAYRRFQGAELPGGLRTQKLSPERAGELLISLDIVQANFSVLRSFDKEEALGASWRDFGARQDLDPALIESKSLRQILFGNLNPKRSQRLQHAFMARVRQALQVDLGVEAEDLAFSSHDELVLSTARSDEPAARCDEIGDWLDHQSFELPLKTSIFRLRAFEKGRYVKTVYRLITVGGTPRLERRYRSLFGVPGNRFYLEFKRHVLDEPLDERDLLFWNDHRLAQWVVR